MSKTLLTLIIAACFAGPLLAQSKPDDDAAYTADITKRADKIVKTLNINDPAKSDRIREVLVNQYRSLRTIHDARDAKLKDIGKEDKAAIDKTKADALGETKKLHESFVEKLNADLSPEQVEKVKDGLTYNKVHVDYNAFCDMLPNLTEEQKSYIQTQLKEAREIAMDGGSSEEKQAAFGKVRGRINNYLSKQGYDLKQASKDWAERRKAREASSKQPADQQEKP